MSSSCCCCCYCCCCCCCCWWWLETALLLDFTSPAQLQGVVGWQKVRHRSRLEREARERVGGKYQEKEKQIPKKIKRNKNFDFYIKCLPLISYYTSLFTKTVPILLMACVYYLQYFNSKAWAVHIMQCPVSSVNFEVGSFNV